MAEHRTDPVLSPSERAAASEAIRIQQGPRYIASGPASIRGKCDCCIGPEGSEDYAVYLIRFGEYMVALCGPCLRRLKNQIRRAEG